MKPREKILFALVFTGVFVLLHLASDTVRWKLPFLASSESVWEHLKMGFWAFVTSYSLWRFPRRRGSLMALFLGAIITVVAIFTAYYSVTSLTGRLGRYPLPLHVGINLGITLLAGLAGVEWSAWAEGHRDRASKGAMFMLIGMWVLSLFLFCLYTYREPPMPLFQEP